MSHSSKFLPSKYLAKAKVEMKLCKAQAIPISIYQSLPVGIPKIAQKPKTRMPKISMVTARSAAVGPRKIRHRQNMAEKNRMRKLRFKSGDCHSNNEGKGQKIIRAKNNKMTSKPISQRKFFINDSSPNNSFKNLF